LPLSSCGSDRSEREISGRETSTSESNDSYGKNGAVCPGMFTDSRTNEHPSPVAGIQLNDSGVEVGLSDSRDEQLTEEYLLSYCKHTDPR
jgi:hypothetical protein